MAMIRSGLIALLIGAFLVPQARAEARLARELDKMGDGICKSLKLDCKKSAKSPRKERPSRARSGKKSAVKTVAPKAGAKTAEAIVVPVPRPKPPRVAIPEPAARMSIVVPRQKPVFPRPVQEQVIVIPPAPPALPRTGDESCMASLKSSGAEFEQVAASAGEGSCRVEMPVRLRSVATPAGRISLPEGPVVACGFALQFSLYLSDMGAAAAAMDKRLAKVATGPGFVCRGRNGDVSGKLSEHAFGNALDITTIGMASGETIQVADALNAGSPSYALLREMRARACGYFSTVLGPGSNAAHAEHFHFDMGRRGKSATYKICE